MSANDIRAKWDQNLDQAPPQVARACRDVGDAVEVAVTMLHQEVGAATPDAVVALAALILARLPAERD